MFSVFSAYRVSSKGSFLGHSLTDVCGSPACIWRRLVVQSVRVRSLPEPSNV